jgi:hypothetical protein
MAKKTYESLLGEILGKQLTFLVERSQRRTLDKDEANLLKTLMEMVKNKEELLKGNQELEPDETLTKADIIRIAKNK